MRKLFFATLMLLPALAHAHPGHVHDAGFAAGLWHPFTGLDHLAALAMAGVLLGWLPRQLRWSCSFAFLGLLGATHVMWSAQAAQAGFVAGLVVSSAGLIAAGMAATRLAAITAAAAR